MDGMAFALPVGPEGSSLQIFPLPRIGNRGKFHPETCQKATATL